MQMMIEIGSYLFLGTAVGVAGLCFIAILYALMEQIFEWLHLHKVICDYFRYREQFHVWLKHKKDYEAKEKEDEDLLQRSEPSGPESPRKPGS